MYITLFAPSTSVLLAQFLVSLIQDLVVEGSWWNVLERPHPLEIPW